MDSKKTEQIKKEKQRNKAYNDYVKKITPTHNCFLNTLYAFVSCGAICLLGQILLNFFEYRGMSHEIAGNYMLLVLILLSVVLTGFNLTTPIAKFAGAGFLVPITGFANSVTACAIEYKKEGQVFGIGCKIFTIAGPVILYGIFFSWIIGLIYWIISLM